MCDCVVVCRRACCRDWCDDCVECGETLRSATNDFCEGFTSEACHSLREKCLESRVCVCATCARSTCEGLCEGDARDAGLNCGRGLASIGSSALSACWCGYQFISFCPSFFVGLFLVVSTVTLVAWLLTNPTFFADHRAQIAQVLDFINRTQAETGG